MLLYTLSCLDTTRRELARYRPRRALDVCESDGGGALSWRAEGSKVHERQSLRASKAKRVSRRDGASALFPFYSSPDATRRDARYERMCSRLSSALHRCVAISRDCDYQSVRVRRAQSRSDKRAEKGAGRGRACKEELQRPRRRDRAPRDANTRPGGDAACRSRNERGTCTSTSTSSSVLRTLAARVYLDTAPSSCPIPSHPLLAFFDFFFFSALPASLRALRDSVQALGNGPIIDPRKRADSTPALSTNPLPRATIHGKHVCEHAIVLRHKRQSIALTSLDSVAKHFPGRGLLGRGNYFLSGGA